MVTHGWRTDVVRSHVARRDRLVVRTLRCGRNNPGSNPGHGNSGEALLSRQCGPFFVQIHVLFLIAIFKKGVGF